MAIRIHSVLIINDYKTGGGVLRQGGGGEAEGEGLGIKRMRRRCWAEKKYEGWNKVEDKEESIHQSVSAPLRSNAFTCGEEKHDGEVFKHFTHFSLFWGCQTTLLNGDAVYQEHFLFSSFYLYYPSRVAALQCNWGISDNPRIHSQLGLLCFSQSPIGTFMPLQNVSSDIFMPRRR